MANSKITLQRIFTVLCLIVAAGLAQADNVYRWVDENGNIHFSQRPPEGRDSEVINPRQPRSFGQSIEDEPADKQAATDDAGTAADSEQAAAVETPEPVFKKDPELCKKAQDYKALLLRNPIVRKNDKALTIDEKNEEMRKAEEIISIHCN